MDFMDTNVIIRYATQDDPVQSPQALAFFRALERGERQTTTCEGVLVEAVQVLESPRAYAFPRPDIRDTLHVLISLRGFRLPNKAVYTRALDLYATTTGLDFVDALNVAHMERLGISTIVSFDRDYDRFPKINREEP